MKEIFKANSAIETCQDLLNIFVQEFEIDFFKKTEFVGKDKRIQKGCSVMEDLFIVLCERKMTEQKKKDLSDKIATLFNAQNRCGVINSDELTQLSEKV